MNERLLILGTALLGATALAVHYYRNRDSGAAADQIESVEQDFLSLLDAPLYSDSNALADIDSPSFNYAPSFLEEVSVTARRIASSVVNPASTSGVRGLRNNNPGNIRKSADKWQGLAAVQDDPAFFKFTEPKYGVRALGKILLNYESKYGLRTVRDIINRWAPPVENNTDSYVKAVARAVEVNQDVTLNVKAVLPKLTAAIIVHENGSNPYSSAQITEWVNLA